MQEYLRYCRTVCEVHVISTWCLFDCSLKASTLSVQFGTTKMSWIDILELAETEERHHQIVGLNYFDLFCFVGICWQYFGFVIDS